MASGCGTVESPVELSACTVECSTTDGFSGSATVACEHAGGYFSLAGCAAELSKANCDFETDLCWWRNSEKKVDVKEDGEWTDFAHMGGDSYDFVRQEGKTEAGFSGPATGHADSPHYAYFAASNHTNQGEAWLIGPTVTVPANSTAKFSFWVHAQGDGAAWRLDIVELSSAGRRRLQPADTTEAWLSFSTNADGSITETWKEGDLGDTWISLQLPLAEFAGSTVKFVFRVRATTSQGDVAFDDFQIQ